MSIREEIKMLLAKKNITMTKLAELLTQKGTKTSIKSISNKLSAQTIKFEEVRKILDVLGYDIQFKERN
ncbi:MAG: DUF6471 domain-containing protein [Candidatus Gastranaerophilaceae bacterium]